MESMSVACLSILCPVLRTETEIHRLLSVENQRLFLSKTGCVLTRCAVSLMVARRTRYPQHEIHNNSCQQRNCQHSRSNSVVEAALAPLPYALRSPVECEQCIDHGRHGDEGKQSGTDLANFIAEVEKADG